MLGFSALGQFAIGQVIQFPTWLITGDDTESWTEDTTGSTSWTEDTTGAVTWTRVQSY